MFLQELPQPVGAADDPPDSADGEYGYDHVANPYTHLLELRELCRHTLLHGVWHSDGVATRYVGCVAQQTVPVLGVPPLLYGVDGIAPGVAVDEYGITEDDAVAVMGDGAQRVVVVLRHGHGDIPLRGAAGEQHHQYDVCEARYQ